MQDLRLPSQSHDCLVGWSKDSELCGSTGKQRAELEFTSVGVEDGRGGLDSEKVRESGLRCCLRDVFRQTRASFHRDLVVHGGRCSCEGSIEQQGGDGSGEAHCGRVWARA